MTSIVLYLWTIIDDVDIGSFGSNFLQSGENREEYSIKIFYSLDKETNSSWIPLREREDGKQYIVFES